MRSSVTISEVHTTDELEALAPEWETLWRRSPAATPFQSPAWLLPWWRHFGSGRLLALAVRNAGGALVGLVPLYVLEVSGLRQLLPLGVGISDYLDGVFDEAWAERAATAVLAHLPHAELLWNVCELPQLRPGSPLLTAAAPAGLVDQVVPGEPSLVVKLPETTPELSRSLPRNMGKNLRRYRKRASESGHLRFERACARSLPTLLATLVRLHGACWSARGLPGVLADGAVQRFHRAAAPALLALGCLRLYVLRLNERPIAGYYGFTVGGRAYAYLLGFDPTLTRLSPGTLALAHAVEEAIREGAIEVDLLRGREAYKQHWGPEERPTYSRKLWREPAPPGTFPTRQS